MKFRTLTLLLALGAGGFALAQPAPKEAATGNLAAPDSPLLLEPKTPAELFDAAVISERLARPAIAKGYLEKFLASNPPDQLLFDLRNQHGPTIFLQLANNRELHPASTQLLDRVNAAYRNRSQDPAFLDSVIAGLSGKPEEREMSQSLIRGLGPAAAPRILHHIGTPQKNDQPEVLVQTLAGLGEPVIPILVAAIDSSIEPMRIGAIQAMGLIGSRKSLPYLLQPALDPKVPNGTRAAAAHSYGLIDRDSSGRPKSLPAIGATAELKSLAREYLSGKVPTQIGEDGKTDLWNWSEKDKAVVSLRVPPATAAIYNGLRLARQALDLSPEDREAQVLLLALHLAWGGLGTAPNSVPSGPGTPYDLALTAGPEIVSETLALAMKADNPNAAIAAVQALARVGARAELYGVRRSKSPLLAALNYPHPDVQFAAAVAILQLNPDLPFRGADRVVEILTRSLSGPDAATAVVIDPNIPRVNDMAGLLDRVGFTTIPVLTGREGFIAAVERAGVKLIAVNANTIDWQLSQTLANLRADARSAHIPIVIYGPEYARSKMDNYIDQFEHVYFMTEALTLESVENQLPDVWKRALAQSTPGPMMAEQMKEAAYWLATIANSNRTNVFKLIPAEKTLFAISTQKDLSANAMIALSAIPTAAVQQHFAQLATTSSLELSMRVAAADALATHIHRHGLLLSLADVAKLETAWRAEQQPELATALAAAVGSLKPNASRVGGRLQRFALPRP